MKAPRYIITSALISAFGIANSYAQEPYRIEVEAFYGMCLYPDKPFDDVSENAPLFGYPPLPDEILQILSPENDPLELNGWVILPQDGIEKGMVLVSRTIIDGTPAQTCGIVFGVTSPFETVALFESLMQPSLLEEQSDGIQITKTYSLTLNEREKLVSAIYSTDPTSTQLSLSVIVFD